ncbi:hypothetical protein KP509_21G082600 [Ceratopteris richardii]|uniref:Uncharacterized protein n=1 Tax=Ceratopteris richardii TaxID=49495 RepID=A0A8T2SEX5_CERRI|nr:hypothetical protein KP509_21G082600 [Ceratopteris richardii]
MGFELGSPKSELQRIQRWTQGHGVKWVPWMLCPFFWGVCMWILYLHSNPGQMTKHQMPKNTLRSTDWQKVNICKIPDHANKMKMPPFFFFFFFFQSWASSSNHGLPPLYVDTEATVESQMLFACRECEQSFLSGIVAELWISRTHYSRCAPFFGWRCIYLKLTNKALF